MPENTYVQLELKHIEFVLATWGGMWLQDLNRNVTGREIVEYVKKLEKRMVTLAHAVAVKVESTI